MVAGWIRHNIVWLVLIGVVFSYGYSCGRGVAKGESYVGQVHARDLGRYDLPPRTFRPPPRLIITERTITDVRVDTIYVPTTIERYRIISDNYLTFGRGQVWVRSYDPTTQEMQVDRFAVPRYDNRIRTGIYAETAYLIGGDMHYGLGVMARYRQATGFIGAQYSFGEPRVAMGVRVEF